MILDFDITEIFLFDHQNKYLRSVEAYLETNF